MSGSCVFLRHVPAEAIAAAAAAPPRVDGRPAEVDRGGLPPPPLPAVAAGEL